MLVYQRVLYIESGWWFGTWIFWLSIYWDYYSQRTNSYLSEGLKPTTRNCMYSILHVYNVSWIREDKTGRLSKKSIATILKHIKTSKPPSKPLDLLIGARAAARSPRPSQKFSMPPERSMSSGPEMGRLHCSGNMACKWGVSILYNNIIYIYMYMYTYIYIYLQSYIYIYR